MKMPDANHCRPVLLVVALIVCLSALLPDVARSAGAAAAPAATIVFPPDKALLTGEASLDLLGYRSAGSAEAVTVTGKGGARSQPVGVGSFSVKITLDPGENVLVLGERKVTVFFAGKDAAAVPPAYSPADMHAVENGCEDCHSFSGSTAKLLEKPPALCARCHDDVLKGANGKALAVLHPPAEEGDCLGCHGFHQLSLKRLPAAAKRALCFGCHDDFTGEGKKRMHAPVAKGECTGCHGPHGAAGDKLLPATGLKLCLLCHADPSLNKEGKALAVAHPALDDGCPSCHLPHVSEAPRLLKKTVAEVCADCHDPFPTEEQGKTLVRHSPVEEGECAACHAVHGSDAVKLLVSPGKTLCVKCHDDPSLTSDGKDWAVAHPALDDGCPSCHLPHVAPAAGMLKKEQAALCYECHDRFVPPGQAGSIHLPVAKGECARCHAPHGSATGKLLLASPSRELCLRCHKDPGLNPAGAPWAVPHPALDDGCPSCHKPHLAAAPRLLASAQRALCAGCHEDKNLNAVGAIWTSPHTPVEAGLCTACHGVHGGQEKSLLKKSPYEICLTCHTEVHDRHTSVELNAETGQPASQQVTLPPGFPVRKGDGALACVGCHLPHGSDFPQLKTKDEQIYCVQCHPF